MLTTVARYWLGEDFFICYARADGAAYAAALANRLSAIGYSCFLDQWHPVSGYEIPKPIRRALVRASSLVVVGTAGADASEPVKSEIAEFSLSRRPIIPIAFGAKLPSSGALSQLAGIMWSCEDASSLASGIPSQGVIDRLQNTLQFRRRNQRVRWTLSSFSMASVVLASASGLLAMRAQASEQIARTTTDSLTNTITRLSVEEVASRNNLARYESATAEAQRQTDSAEYRGRIARDALRSLAVATKELDRSLDLVQNKAVTFDFDHGAVSPRALEVLNGLLSLIRTSGYQGRIRINAHVARFCVVYSRRDDSGAIAPAAMPIDRCRFQPASDAYALKLSQSLGREIVATATKVGLDARTIEIQAYGDQRPRRPYPTSGNAADWNATALLNNRVEIELYPDSTRPRP